MRADTRGLVRARGLLHEKEREDCLYDERLRGDLVLLLGSCLGLSGIDSVSSVVSGAHKLFHRGDGSVTVNVTMALNQGLCLLE